LRRLLGGQLPDNYCPWKEPLSGQGTPLVIF